jgi:hypothetical protein
MGLDIQVSVNNEEAVFSDDYHDVVNNYFVKHSLSREFCNFICRQHVVDHKAELDQIGEITNVDIAPFYEMENYPDEDELEFELENEEDEAEIQNILLKAEEEKNKLNGNIDKVLSTVNNLIEKLNQVDNLPKMLLKTDFDTLNNDVYFSDFTLDKGEGYIGNNFGQDLRNFKRFLEFAKQNGTETVWFTYG